MRIHLTPSARPTHPRIVCHKAQHHPSVLGQGGGVTEGRVLRVELGGVGGRVVDAVTRTQNLQEGRTGDVNEGGRMGQETVVSYAYVYSSHCCAIARPRSEPGLQMVGQWLME